MLDISQFNLVNLDSLFLKCLLITGTLLSFLIPAKRIFPRTPLSISSLFYFAGLASIVSVTVAFNASAAKPIMYTFLSANVAWSLIPSSWKFYKYLCTESRKFCILSFKFIVILGSLIAPLFNRFSSFPDKIISINNHEIYFSEISLEILNADYSSRLRLTDSYPAEWSTYGFFSGSANAIPLVFIDNLTIFDIFLAKIVLIVFLVLLISEQIPLKPRNIASFGFTTLFFFAGHLQFALISYHIFTLLLLLLIVVVFRKYRGIENSLLSLMLALSHPRGVFVGLGFVIYFVIRSLKNEVPSIKKEGVKEKIAINLNYLIFFTLYLFTLATVFLSGKSSPEQSAIDVSKIKDVINAREPIGFIENVLAVWFAPPWQLSFGVGTYLEANQTNFQAIDDINYHLFAYVLYYLILIAVSLSRILQSRGDSSQRRIQLLYALVLVSLAIYFLLDYFIIPESQTFIFIRQFCLFSILPIVSLSIAMDPNDRDLRNLLLFCTLLPCLFTNAGIWGPMLMSIEVISFYFLWKHIFEYKTYLNKIGMLAFSLLASLLILFPPVRLPDILNANTRDPYTHKIDFSKLPKPQSVACSNINDSKLMALSFLGFRVAYDAHRPENYVVARRFAILEDIPAITCEYSNTTKTEH